MGETLTQQRRVSEEGLRIVKLFYLRKMCTELIPRAVMVSDE